MFAGQLRKFRRSNRRRQGTLRRSIWLEALEPQIAAGRENLVGRHSRRNRLD